MYLNHIVGDRPRSSAARRIPIPPRFSTACRTAEGEVLVEMTIEGLPLAAPAATSRRAARCPVTPECTARRAGVAGDRARSRRRLR